MGWLTSLGTRAPMGMSGFNALLKVERRLSTLIPEAGVSQGLLGHKAHKGCQELTDRLEPMAPPELMELLDRKVFKESLVTTALKGLLVLTALQVLMELTVFKASREYKVFKGRQVKTGPTPPFSPGLSALSLSPWSAQVPLRFWAVVRGLE